MHFRLSRLRRGELVSAAAVVVMVVALFGLKWYGASAGPSGRSPAVNGWTGATHLRWLLVIAILAGVAVVVTQAACRAPAIPASLDVLATVVAFVAVLWLVFRVLLDAPAHQLFGAWLELIGALGLLAGAFGALRQEGIAAGDGPGEIPVVELGGPGAASP